MEKLPANITTVQQQKRKKICDTIVFDLYRFYLSLTSARSLSFIHLLTYVLLAEMPCYNSIWQLVIRIGWLMFGKSSYGDIEPKKKYILRLLYLYPYAYGLFFFLSRKRWLSGN